MGFSLAAAAAIIGVSTLIVIGTTVENILPTMTDTNDSYDDMKNRAIDQVQTDINITSVITPSNGSNYDLNFTVDNTGSVILETSYFNILINGTAQQFTCTGSYLYPENEVYFNVTNLPGAGTRILKVITDNGISDYYEYAIV